MGGGKRSTSKSNSYRRLHLNVSPNDVDVISANKNDNKNDNDNDCYSKKKQHLQRPSKQRVVCRSKNNRVHPAMPNVEDNSNDGLASNGGQQQQRGRHKKKTNLTIETNGDNNNSSSSKNNERRSPSSCNTPSGFRGSKDLRSPGMPKSPVVGIGSQQGSKTTPSQPSVAIPDFITQTDASGNATTPRSAEAINGAHAATVTTITTKTHTSNRRDANTGNFGGNGEHDNNSNSSSKDVMTETCDTIVDSFRSMCCCLVQTEIDDGANPKSISGKETQDSDENIDTTENNKNRIKLLGSPHPDDAGKKCLVLDLDETLVHSSFRAVEGADFVIPVQIEDVVHFVYVAKRPGVDEFLIEMAKHYEIVIYTASLNKYADPLLDLLDLQKVIRYRLFRESCVFYEGNYVKDLSVLDRDLSSTIIIDNSPNSYLFHPENAIDCSSFIDDPRDRELDQIGSFLTGIKNAKDVRGICHQWKDWPVINPINEEDLEEIR